MAGHPSVGDSHANPLAESKLATPMAVDANPYDSPLSESPSHTKERWPARLLVIAAVGNLLAALSALSFMRYPVGSDFLFSGENLFVALVVLLTAMPGICEGAIAIHNGRHLFLSLLGIVLCLTPCLLFKCLKLVIFAVNDLSD